MQSLQYCIFLISHSLFLFLTALTSADGVKVYPVYENGTSFVKAEFLRTAEVKCKVDKFPANTTLRWYRNNEVVEQSEKIKISGDKLEIHSVSEEEGGIYECRVVPINSPPTVTALAQATVEVKVFPYLRIVEKDQSVVEENPFNVTCFLKGPEMEIKWSFKNDSNVTMERPAIYYPNEEGIKNGRLHIEKANKTDRGYYRCYVEYGGQQEESEGRVRVKGKYAALWPFLGICAEVVILCTIIFIYEKRRDKTELEESDTDQGPETKNSPDHRGVDSVRHRK